MAAQSSHEVDSIYASCACSPLGKLSQQSLPYPGTGTVLYTAYNYHALGRTTTVTLPDGSQTVYTYQGNMVTVIDPAGKWKQYASDAFGNLRTVLEPDPTAQPVPGPPSSPPTYPVGTALTGMLLTSYTYDQSSHLTQVRQGGVYGERRTFGISDRLFGAASLGSGVERGARGIAGIPHIGARGTDAGRDCCRMRLGRERPGDRVQSYWDWGRSNRPGASDTR